MRDRVDLARDDIGVCDGVLDLEHQASCRAWLAAEPGIGVGAGELGVGKNRII
jgi:hypothetical protein